MILSDRSIREAVVAQRIVIEPLEDRDVQPSSVDLHIDRFFRVFRNDTTPYIDPKQPQEDLTELVEIEDDAAFILHPGEFVLGSTYERVALPDDLVARLEGKSSLGRLGLLIHSTAGFVDAGWDGHLTLELSNVANLPDRAVPADEDRPDLLLRDVDPGRPPVRQQREGLEVPGPARPDPEPVLPQLPRPVSRARTRCPWAGSDPQMVAYHDDEWGVPQHDDHRLFEKISLEGAQAGLSWSTILRKREGYRRAFAGFDPLKVARFTPAKVERLLLDPEIVRNRAKVESTVANARAVNAVQRELGSLDAYLWAFVDGTPIQHRHRDISTLEAQTAISVAMSKDMKRRGFRFVGPTTMYALMQSVGMVNDHLVELLPVDASSAGSSRGRA